MLLVLGYFALNISLACEDDSAFIEMLLVLGFFCPVCFASNVITNLLTAIFFLQISVFNVLILVIIHLKLP